MQAELTAASRHEHLVLFDPAAVPVDTPVDPDLEAQDPKLLPKAAIKDLAARGQALILHIPTEDCEARLRVFVDEQPTEQTRKRGKVVLAGAALHVPSGLLKADGLEFLTRPGEARTHSEAEQMTVPAGRYSVEVLELLSWKMRHRIAEGRRALGSLDKTIHRLVTTYTWLGIVLIPANIFVAPMVVMGFWRSRGWQAGLAAGAVVLAVDALVLGGFWVLQAAQKRLPILSRVADADAAFERENPDIIVVLRPGASEAQAGPPALAKVRIRRDDTKDTFNADPLSTSRSRDSGEQR